MWSVFDSARQITFMGFAVVVRQEVAYRYMQRFPHPDLRIIQ